VHTRNEQPTQQELAVLEAIIEAGTIAGAARLLQLSPHTVDSHLDALRAKARKRYLAQVVAWAYCRGFVPGSQPLRAE
jgi:FixJ family two-component response regulator